MTPAPVANTEQELVITRTVNARRELVFAAWTDPRQLVQWWGPQGCVSFDCQVDLRVGGEFKLQMRTPDGGTCPCQGIYREIISPERIVYVGTPEAGHACGAGLPPRATVEVSFAELNGKTTVTILTRFESLAACEAALEAGYQPGWTSCLERLEGFVTAT